MTGAPKNWSDVNGTAHLTALHRSFPEAGDGRPLPPMGDELMTAGLSADDARFVAVQLAQNGYQLVTQADLEAHIGAVLEEAAQHVSRDSLRWRYSSPWSGNNFAEEIRALRPDAMQALERVRRDARVEVLRKIEQAMHHHPFTNAEWNMAGRDVRTAFSTYLSKLIAAEERGEGE